METVSQQEDLTAQALIDALPAVALQLSNPLILQINNNHGEELRALKQTPPRRTSGGVGQKRPSLPTKLLAKAKLGFHLLLFH